MESISDFFGHQLVVPAYYYFLAYGVVWAIAFVLAQLFITKKGIERAVIQAWSIALFLHMIGGLFFITWIFIRANNTEEEWSMRVLYLLLYLIILIADICLLCALYNQRSKKEKTTEPTQRMTSKSRNPKKTQ